MLENAQAEITEGEGRKVRIERADEVFVEPLCFFDLKAYSLHRFQFFLWQIDYEAYTEIIQPCNINISKQAKDEVHPDRRTMGVGSDAESTVMSNQDRGWQLTVY